MKKYILEIISVFVLIVFLIAFPRSTETTIYLTGGVEPVGEVWIADIEINGQKDSLKTYPLSGKWEYINENIVYVPSDSQDEDMLELCFNNAKSVRITFWKHDWSGGLGIYDGDEYTELNLCDQTGSVVYDVKNIKPVMLESENLIVSILSLGILLILLLCIDKKHRESKQNNWGLVVINTVVFCRIADAFNMIGYMLFALFMMYFLFVKSKVQNHRFYYITLAVSFVYSLYQFANPYLPDSKSVMGILFLLLVFYSLEIGIEKVWSRYIVIAITPILCFFMIECISNVNISQLKGSMIVLGIVITSIFLFITVNVICFKNLGWYLSFLSAFVISVGNYYVIQFKKYALTFGDLMQLKTGMAVAGDYQYYLSNEIVYGFLILIVLISLVHFYIPAEPLTVVKVKKRMFTGIIMLFLQLGVVRFIDFQQTFHVAWDNWDTTQTYSKYGFLVSFITSVQRMNIEEPDGYSKEKAENILNKYTSDIIEGEEEKPVIIAIMNESLSDLNDLGSLGETEDVMWYLNSMDDFLEKGKTFMSVRGGGTCNSEFEFLTGNSMGFFKDLYPYTQYSFNEIPSLTNELKNLGYKTVAMHPASATNYRRQGVYKEMGFDEFYSIDSYDDKYEKVFLDRISDGDNYREIIKRLENSNKDEPLFIFNVTIQNHGDYDMAQFNPSYERIKIDSDLEQYDSAWMYLSLIKESNNALKYLVDELRKIDRPIILCVFGDHQPGCLSTEFEEQIFEWDQTQSELANQQRYYMTPYFIWANYSVNEPVTGKDGQVSSPNYLAAKLLKYAGLKTTNWFDFLYEMQQHVPVINSFGYMGDDEIWHDMDEQNSYTKWIHDYRILQYYQVIQKK